MIHGYARVSTDGQSLQAQLDQLRAADCSRLHQEKVSGAKSDRKELARMLAALTAGDVVVVTRLDRLARSTRDLLNILDHIATKGATFRSLSDVWADTTTPHGRLMLANMLTPSDQSLPAQTTFARRNGSGSGSSRLRGANFKLAERRLGITNGSKIYSQRLDRRIR